VVAQTIEIRLDVALDAQLDTAFDGTDNQDITRRLTEWHRSPNSSKIRPRSDGVARRRARARPSAQPERPIWRLFTLRTGRPSPVLPVVPAHEARHPGPGGRRVRGSKGHKTATESLENLSFGLILRS